MKKLDNRNVFTKPLLHAKLIVTRKLKNTILDL